MKASHANLHVPTDRYEIRQRSLKLELDRMYAAFNYPESAMDPIEIVRRFREPEDREIAGFVAAALAFGRVASVIQSTERVLAALGDRPGSFVRSFAPRRHARRFAGIGHRWIRGRDIAALVWLLSQMVERAGSIEGFFLEGYRAGDGQMAAALDSFSSRALALDLATIYGEVPKRPGVSYFFPRPSAGSACKRLNLFLRWMVRRDSLDLGVWSRVSAADLIVPLDTHVIRLGRCLRLTRYVSPGWRMAMDITSSLRALDAEDPVKYDFALCHLGMMNACGFSRPQKDAHCPLGGVCQPVARTRRRSRRPSARP